MITNNHTIKELNMRHPQYQISVISKYNDSAFICYVEQVIGRMNCVLVVSKNPLIWKSQKEELGRIWEEYCALCMIGQPAPGAIQDVLMHGGPSNKPAGRVLL